MVRVGAERAIAMAKIADDEIIHMEDPYPQSGRPPTRGLAQILFGDDANIKDAQRIVHHSLVKVRNLAEQFRTIRPHCRKQVDPRAVGA